VDGIEELPNSMLFDFAFFRVLYMFFSYVAGSNSRSSRLFDISSSTDAPARKTGADDFLNSEIDKNDYEWYVLLWCLSVYIFHLFF
jgi:hypothetical protein